MKTLIGSFTWRLVLLCVISSVVCFGTSGKQPALAGQQTQPVHRIPPPEQMRFESYSLEQGLSQSVVTALAQDNSGFLWLATQDGLNRFDGYEFQTFKPKPQDSTSLGAGLLTSLLVDHAGILWIGTNGGGLERYDPGLERFIRYTNDPNNPQSLSADIVLDIEEDAQGDLWVTTTGGGLNRFDRASETFVQYLSQPDQPDGLSSNDLTALVIDGPEMIWIGTYGEGLELLDPRTGSCSQYRNDPDNHTSLSNDFITALSLDENGMLWIGTLAGLNRLDTLSGRFTQYLSDPAKPTGLGGDSITALFHDQQGRLWIGTNNAGLYRYDPSLDGFHRFEADPSDPTGLPANSITSIYQDRAGSLWFGVFGGGVSQYDPTRQKFARYQHDPTDPGSLSEGGVWSFYQDSQGVFWIGTISGGLTWYAEDEGKFLSYVNDPADPSSLGDNFVMSMSEDAWGNFWVGTQSRGLYRLERASGQFTPYPSPAVILEMLSDSLGNFWIATNDGLGLYRPDSDDFTYYKNAPGDASTLSDNFVTSLYEDRDGNLWVGTFNYGLNRYNRQDDDFIRYENLPTDPSSLANNTVLDILEDHSGTLWVGTAGGLEKFDPQTQIFTHYTESNGLPNNTIYAILEDETGNLWLSTNRGISKLNPLDGTINNYDTGDGLQSVEFNQGAAYMLPDGEMFFGGINGFNAFFPEEIQERAYLPPIVLTDFLLFNTSVSPGSSAVLPQAISQSQEIHLNYQQNFFTFEFSALDYSDPSKNQYAYWMKGLDPDWNQVGDRRIAVYTNVPPGDYTFTVIGTNSDGVWNEEGTSVRVIVTPPFWQTWWFRLLAAGVVIGLVAGGFGLRLRMVQGQKRKLEIQVEERTRDLNTAMHELLRAKDAAEAANRAKSVFLANISHELRTPLNAILGFSQLMLNQISPAGKPTGAAKPGAAKLDAADITLSAEQRENLEVINRSGEHLLGLINDVLDMSKIESGRISLNEHPFDLYHMLEGLEDMFRLRAEEKGLTLDFDYEPVLTQYIQADEGKLRQVLMNLLGNAVKFTRQGGVSVRIDQLSSSSVDETERIWLSYKVQDSGPGIAAEEQASIFEPFVQSTSGRQAQEGTGLGLAISRQYAELMGGSISLVSTAGQEHSGSIFTLLIPVIPLERSDVQAAMLHTRVIGLAPGQPEYRLLVVDDKEVNRKLLARLLAPLGFQIEQASNGQEAIEVWERWQPHLIWMDMRMPVMDGYEATRRIKATLKGQATVIIALTASALEEDRKVILSEGCDDYIRKPFHDQELYDALTRHLGVRFLTADLENATEGENDFIASEGIEAGRPKSFQKGLQPGELVSRVRKISPESVRALNQAALLGSLDEIMSAISQIRLQDAELADLLQSWAEDFRHEKILALIDQAGGDE